MGVLVHIVKFLKVALFILYKQIEEYFVDN